MQQAITAEHFSIWDEPLPSLEPSGLLGEVERKIEMAIECGDLRALDAATVAIDLLDAIDGEPDAEPVDEREPEEPCVGNYGIDQSEPIGWNAGRAAPGYSVPPAWAPARRSAKTTSRGQLTNRPRAVISRKTT